MVRFFVFLNLPKNSHKRLRCGLIELTNEIQCGGHLWFFAAPPWLARDCRPHVYSLAARLKLAVKGVSLAEGIEVFPRHDSLNPGEFGNAIRGPLGVHQADKKRYWFYGADYTLEAQMKYLKELRKLTEQQLTSLVATLPLPRESCEGEPAGWDQRNSGQPQPQFRILDHVQVRRKSSRNPLDALSLM
jgi:hypothetical protein